MAPTSHELSGKAVRVDGYGEEGSVYTDAMGLRSYDESPLVLGPGLRSVNEDEAKPYAFSSRVPLANLADPYQLYNASVCNAPEDTAAFISKSFRQERGREAETMREDFCGTALIAMAWISESCKKSAVGIDCDEEVLAWSKSRHAHRVDKDLDPALLECDESELSILRDDLRERVDQVKNEVSRLRLIESDVMDAREKCFPKDVGLSELQSLSPKPHGRNP